MIEKKLGYYKSCSGFTLIELALVIIISGSIMVAAAQFMKIYTINLKYEKNIKHLKMSQDAINEFFGMNGRYPCPANPTLLPSDDGYGLEQCRSAFDLANNRNDCTVTPSAAGETGLPGIVGTPEDLSCTTEFSRDGDQNGQPDVVMMGIIPFRTLADNAGFVPYVERYKLDAYYTYISYAVTEHMSDRTRFDQINPVNPNTGAIRVEDENDISLTAPDSLPQPNGTAHYVIYSHGDNRKGGYLITGNMVDNCFVSLIPGDDPVQTPSGPSANGIADEIENCDNNDAIFKKGIRSTVDGSDYNDDILLFKATGAFSLWRNSLASNGHIFNTNIGNVGVGTDSPTHKLHVVGDLSAETNTTSVRYCDDTSNDCLLPATISGTGYAETEAGGTQPSCPPNEVAYAIHENRILCRRVNWTLPTQSCPLGEYLVGFSNAGSIECSAP